MLDFNASGVQSIFLTGIMSVVLNRDSHNHDFSFFIEAKIEQSVVPKNFI